LKKIVHFLTFLLSNLNFPAENRFNISCSLASYLSRFSSCSSSVHSHSICKISMIKTWKITKNYNQNHSFSGLVTNNEVKITSANQLLTFVLFFQKLSRPIRKGQLVFQKVARYRKCDLYDLLFNSNLNKNPVIIQCMANLRTLERQKVHKS